MDHTQYDPRPLDARPLATAASNESEPATYAEWIADYVARHGGRVTAMCGGATEDMVAAFPELRRVRGHYSLGPLHRAAHWWCVTANGDIVDPTVSQFASPDGSYEEYSGPDPVGKCLYCGAYVWEDTGLGSHACSVDCYNELAAEYHMPPLKTVLVADNGHGV